jgi:hypothetical protein
MACICTAWVPLEKKKMHDLLKLREAWTIDATIVDSECPRVDCHLSSPSPTLVSSSETRVNLEIRSRKKFLYEPARWQVNGGIYSTETWRPEALHRGLEFGKSQTRSKVGKFECPSSLNGSFLEGEHRGFLKEGSQVLMLKPMTVEF